MADTGSDNPDGTQPGDEPKAAAFSQADVDKMVGERLSRETRKLKATHAKELKTAASAAVEGFLADRGFDLDTFEAAVQAPDEAEAIKREHRALKGKHTKLENEFKSALERANSAEDALWEIRSRDEVTRAAAKFNAHDGDVVWDHVKGRLRRGDDNTPYVVDKHGEDAGISIDQLIEGLRSDESKMFLFRPDDGVGGGGSRTTPTSSSKPQQDGADAALAELARRYGRQD